MKSKPPNGTPGATNPRVSPKNDAPAVSLPETVGDVMDILSLTTHSYKMLPQTNTLLAIHFNMPAEKILLDILDERNINSFCLGLGKYKANAVSTYRKHVQFLLNTAKRNGWKPGQFVPQAWRELLALSRKHGCSSLAKAMSALRSKPQDVSIQDVEDWTLQRGRDGFNCLHAKRNRTVFWRLLREVGCTSQRPLCLIRDKNYGIKLENFPPAFRQEVL